MVAPSPVAASTSHVAPPRASKPRVAKRSSGEASSSARYAAAKTFATGCAAFVTSLFECPPPVATATKPAIPLNEFIAYALYRTRLDESVALSALILLQRLKARYPQARGSSGHRLWLAAIMLANKMANDDSFTNASWHIASQQLFSQREVNAVERELFGYLEYDTNVTGEEIERFAASFALWRQAALTPPPAPVAPSLFSSTPSAPSSYARPAISAVRPKPYPTRPSSAMRRPSPSSAVSSPDLSDSHSASSSRTPTPLSTPPTPTSASLAAAHRGADVWNAPPKAAVAFGGGAYAAGWDAAVAGRVAA